MINKYLSDVDVLPRVPILVNQVGARHTLYGDAREYLVEYLSAASHRQGSCATDLLVINAAQPHVGIRAHHLPSVKLEGYDGLDH